MFEARTVISVSDEGVDFWVEGTFVNIIQASVHMTVPFTGQGRGKSNLAAKESGGSQNAGRNWKVSSSSI